MEDQPESGRQKRWNKVAANNGYPQREPPDWFEDPELDREPDGALIQHEP